MAAEWKYMDFGAGDLHRALSDGLDGALLAARNYRNVMSRERPNHPRRSGGRPFTDHDWAIRIEQQENYIALIAGRSHDFEQDPVYMLRALADELERAVSKGVHPSEAA